MPKMLAHFMPISEIDHADFLLNEETHSKGNRSRLGGTKTRLTFSCRNFLHFPEAEKMHDIVFSQS